MIEKEKRHHLALKSKDSLVMVIFNVDTNIMCVGKYRNGYCFVGDPVEISLSDFIKMYNLNKAEVKQYLSTNKKFTNKIFKYI